MVVRTTEPDCRGRSVHRRPTLRCDGSGEQDVCVQPGNRRMAVAAPDFAALVSAWGSAGPVPRRGCGPGGRRGRRSSRDHRASRRTTPRARGRPVRVRPAGSTPDRERPRAGRGPRRWRGRPSLRPQLGAHEGDQRVGQALVEGRLTVEGDQLGPCFERLLDLGVPERGSFAAMVRRASLHRSQRPFSSESSGSGGGWSAPGARHEIGHRELLRPVVRPQRLVLGLGFCRTRRGLCRS